jgi:hypothetical protein
MVRPQPEDQPAWPGPAARSYLGERPWQARRTACHRVKVAPTWHLRGVQPAMEVLAGAARLRGPYQLSDVSTEFEQDLVHGGGSGQDVAALEPAIAT